MDKLKIKEIRKHMMAEMISKVIQLYYSGNCLRYYQMKYQLGGNKNIITRFCEFREQAQYDILEKELLKYFAVGVFRKGLPKEIIHDIQKCLKDMDTSKERFELSYETLMEKIALTSYSCLSVSLWKMLSLIMTSNGMFRLGRLCRIKASECVENSNSNRFIIQKFHVYMEKREYTKAANIILKMQKRSFLKKYLSEHLQMYQNYLVIMTQSIPDFASTYNRMEKNTQQYYDFIKEKRIAIVGPAPGEEQEIRLLQDVDVIIRFNYRGKELLDENQRIYKTSISYYSTGYCEWINEQKNKSFLNEMNYMLCNQKYTKCFPEDLKQRVINYQVIEPLFFLGYPNMLPMVLFHLCQCGRNNIEIYRNNLYLGKNIWSKEYNLHSKKKQQEMFWWPSFAQHEISSQFIFLKNMYLEGLIKPDEELKRVLDLTVDEYVENMEKCWVLEVIPYKMNVHWAEET